MLFFFINCYSKCRFVSTADSVKPFEIIKAVLYQIETIPLLHYIYLPPRHGYFKTLPMPHNSAVTDCWSSTQMSGCVKLLLFCGAFL